MEPWGISGPAFVWLFLALLIVPLIVRGFLRAAIRRTNNSSATYARPLSIYHLAYLVGGPKRTVETVIAALVDRGQLRVNSRKKLKAVGALPADPLERVVAESANDAVGSTTTGVMNWVRSSSQLKTLAAELEAQGLLIPASKRRTVRRTVFFLYVVVFAIGIARWVNGVSLDRPVGLLSAELIVAFIVCVFVATMSAGRVAKAGPTLTSAGVAVLAQARSERAPRPRSSRQAPREYSQNMPYSAVLVGAAGAVALGGLAMYPDPEVSEALMRQPIAGGGGSSGGGDSSSASGCGSGGSGGGGGCGGGCGG